jgi:hypothetical protein
MHPFQLTCPIYQLIPPPHSNHLLHCIIHAQLQQDLKSVSSIPHKNTRPNHTVALFSTIQVAPVNTATTKPGWNHLVSINQAIFDS